MSEMPDSADVVVVGGGPAGLSAATELRRLGAGRVTLLERDAEAGGIPRHCGHYPFGMREFHRVLRGPDYAARLVAQAVSAGVEIRRQVTVTALHPGGRLSVATPDGVGAIAARAVVLATGVRETSRAQRLIGGEKPGGILSTGALQGLVYLEGARPFSRPAILGSELVAFSALITCRHLGIRPVAMIEAGRRPTAYSPAILLARAMGVPFLTGTTVEAILGREWVQGLVVASAAGSREIAADGVIVTGSFRPEATLLRQSQLEVDVRSGGPVVDSFGRLSDPAYFATGNLLRAVETAGWCWAEGRRTARSVAAVLTGSLPDRSSGIRFGVEGDALKFAIPQVLLPGPPGPGMADSLQIRLRRPASGRLALMDGDRSLAERGIDSLPERRILMRVPSLPAASNQTGSLRLILRED